MTIIPPQNSGPQRSSWRNQWLWLGAALLLLAGLTLSRSPWVPPNPSPTAADALALRAVFERARGLERWRETEPFSLSWTELRAAAVLGGPAVSLPHLQIEQANQGLIIGASKALPLGFWANASVTVAPGEGGAPLIRGRFGHIPLPAPVMRGLIWAIRHFAGWRGMNVPPVDAMVRNLSVTGDGVSAKLTVPRDPGLPQVFSGLIGGALGEVGPDPVDAAAVSRHYCRLAALEIKQPDKDFAAHVRRAFAGSADDPRARLLALAMITVSPEVGQLVGSTPSADKGCTPARAATLLNKRLDLPKHWALSAALSASLGANASSAMGVWKEMADSSEGGSGFSYADRAADRMGIFVAERLADPARAPALQKWLANVTQAQLLPIQKLALAEGMSESEFAARYDTVDSARDKAVIARIDATLAAILPH